MIDPFESINKTLRQVGAQPIKLGAPVAKSIGSPSSTNMTTQLTPEQREEVEGGIGHNLLSGLGYVGEKLDALFGARALRGVLGGDFREALSVIPIIGTFGDELGLTSKDDYMDNTGRRLLEKAGVLGENEEGLDAGDVAGFAVDVLLDPINALTLGGGGLAKATATSAGKLLQKTGKAGEIIKAAGKTAQNMADAGIQSIKGAESIGGNEAAMQLTLGKLLKLDESADVNFINSQRLNDPASLTGNRTLRQQLEDAGADLSNQELLNMPIASPVATGLPFRKEGKIFGKYHDIGNSPKLQKFAAGLDTIGDKVSNTFSPAKRLGAKLFNPFIKRGETQEATQQLAKQTGKAQKEVEQYVKNELMPLNRAAIKSGLFDWRAIQKQAAGTGQPLSKAQAKDVARRRHDYINEYLENYERLDTGELVLPEWDLSHAEDLQSAYKVGIDNINNQLNELSKAGPLNPAVEKQYLSKRAELQKAVDELESVITGKPMASPTPVPVAPTAADSTSVLRPAPVALRKRLFLFGEDSDSLEDGWTFLAHTAEEAIEEAVDDLGDKASLWVELDQNHNYVSDVRYTSDIPIDDAPVFASRPFDDDIAEIVESNIREARDAVDEYDTADDLYWAYVRNTEDTLTERLGEDVDFDGVAEYFEDLWLEGGLPSVSQGTIQPHKYISQTYREAMEDVAPSAPTGGKKTYDHAEAEYEAGLRGRVQAAERGLKMYQESYNKGLAEGKTKRQLSHRKRLINATAKELEEAKAELLEYEAGKTKTPPSAPQPATPSAPTKRMTPRKQILSHPAVESIEDAFGGDDYRYEIILKDGYVFDGYETTWKHITSLKEGAELLSRIVAKPAAKAKPVLQNPQSVIQKHVDNLTHLAKNPSKDLDPEFVKAASQIRGGVHGRQAPKINPEIADIQPVLDKLRARLKDVEEYAAARGVDKAVLRDNWARYFPRRSFTFPVAHKINKFVPELHTPKQKSTGYGDRVDMFSPDQMARSDELVDVYGGTSTINRLAQASNDDGYQFAGRLLVEMNDKERLEATEKLASDIADWFESNLYTGSQELRGKEYFNRMLLRDDAGDLTGKLDPKNFMELADTIGNINPRHAGESMPFFESNPIKMVGEYVSNTVRVAHLAEGLTNMMAENAMLLDGVRSVDRNVSTISNIMGSQLKLTSYRAKKNMVDQLLKQDSLMAGLKSSKPDQVSDEIMEVLLKTPDELAASPSAQDNFSAVAEQFLSNFKINDYIANELGKVFESFTNPDQLRELTAGFDALTDMLKTSLTTPFPAYHVRNLISGVMSNVFARAHDPTASRSQRHYKQYAQMRQIIRGQVPENIATELTQVSTGTSIFEGMTDEEAVDAIVDLLISHDVVGRRHTREELMDVVNEGELGDWFGKEFDNVPRRAENESEILPGLLKQGIDKFREEIPRRVPDDNLPPSSQAFKHLTGSEFSAFPRYDRFVDKVGRRGPIGWFRRATRMGRTIGELTENMVRGGGFIALLKQGYSPAEAARKIKLAQVDYSALSVAERKYFKRVIPFYTYTRRQIPFIVETIMRDLDGPMVQGIRAAGRIQRDSNRDDIVPEYISQTVGIPLPGAAEGQQRYLTGLGGILGGVEDVTSLFRPGRGALDTAGRTLRGIASRAHPAVQPLLELVSGRSMFSGRELTELSPTPTARLLGQLTGSDEPVGTSVFTPEREVILQRLPAYGRLVSTARGLSDWPRRPIVGEEGFSPVNLLARVLPSTTGMRISDVDLDRQQNRLLQDIIEQHLKTHPDSRQFEHMYFREEDLPGLDPETMQMYMLYKQLASESAKRARAEKKAAQAQTAQAYSN